MSVHVCVCVSKMLAAEMREMKKTPKVLHCHSDMEKSWEGRDKGMINQTRLIHTLDKRDEVKIGCRGEGRVEKRKLSMLVFITFSIVSPIPLQICCRSDVIQNCGRSAADSLKKNMLYESWFHWDMAHACVIQSGTRVYSHAEPSFELQWMLTTITGVYMLM